MALVKYSGFPGDGMALSVVHWQVQRMASGKVFKVRVWRDGRLMDTRVSRSALRAGELARELVLFWSERPARG